MLARLKTLIFSEAKYHQVWLIESSPYGEVIHPFQFSVGQRLSKEEIGRLAKVGWRQLVGKTGFWTTTNIVFKQDTVEDRQGIIPKVNGSFSMGSYDMVRRAMPTTHINITD